MAQVTKEWKNWLAENVERGVLDLDLITIMKQNNFNAAVAQAALADVKRQLKKTQEQAVEITIKGPQDKPQAHAQEQQKHGTPSQDSNALSTANQQHQQALEALDNDLLALDVPLKRVIELKSPCVIVYDNLLTHAECDALIELSKAKMKPSTVVDNETGGSVMNDHRKSQGTYFHKHTNDFVNRLDERLAKVMNVTLAQQEDIQILNYQVGGEYRPHFDYFSPETNGSKVQLQRGGQRIATMIMYLNDVEEGGSTTFPELGLSVTPKKGRGVYFTYFNDGEVDPRSLHAGDPVIRGEKWIATKWIREGHFC
jgi:prolyl 4-hydroxylase